MRGNVAQRRSGSFVPWRLFCSMLVITACTQVAHAQSGLREALERLDRNENGFIEPKEVTPLARPYLERIITTRGKELRFEKPMEIAKIQEAARIYHAFQNGVRGEDVQPEGESTVQGFGPKEDENHVPGFGLAKFRFPYIQADLDLADKIMGRYDLNSDGYIDREESKHSRWTHRNPFDDDLNEDERISKMELVQRYARRRLLKEDSGELVKKAWRTGGEIKPSVEDKGSNSEWWRKGGSTFWLTAAMMGRFDKNRNGRLEANEAIQTALPVRQIDADQDNEITRDELHAYVTQLQNEAGDVTAGLPGWFFELDTDKDQQVAMHEFLTEENWSLERRAEFDNLDLNDDGLLTSSELLQARSIIGGDFRNEDAMILPPQRTVISEIVVEEDFLVKRLQVQLSITHTHVDQLDVYLTGPDGDRVELFTEIGGSGDNFEGTTFDDYSSRPIIKARSPFEGTYRPEAIDKRQPGLGRFSGRSIKGVWQLVVRATRSERFGMLHGWGLKITPAENDLADRPMAEISTTSPVPVTGPQPTTSSSTSVRPAKAEKSAPSSIFDFFGGDSSSDERSKKAARREMTKEEKMQQKLQKLQEKKTQDSKTRE